MSLSHVDSNTSSKSGEEANGSIHDETEVADVSSGNESFHDIPNDMIDEEEHFIFEKVKIFEWLVTLYMAYIIGNSGGL